MTHAPGRQLAVFNSFCLFLILCFAIGTVWVWRNTVLILPAARPNEEIVLQRVQFNPTSDPQPLAAVATTSPTTTSSEGPVSESEETSPEIETAVQIALPSTSSTTQAYNELQGIHEQVVLNLDVPYSSQAPERNWEQPWQDACEEVSILMLDAWEKGYGLSPLFVKDEIEKMVAWQEARGWGGSIAAAQVVELYEQFFGGTKRLRIVEHPTAEQIKAFLQAGKPVLALADGRALPNQWYTDDGPDYHALIIRGYTADGRFITNDPGVNRGRNFAFTEQSLLAALHDWNGGRVGSGKPVVLVLE